MTCAYCGRELTSDEVGATKKLINRGTAEFYCLSCLSARYDIPEERLRQKIEDWREMGCLLFTKK